MLQAAMWGAIASFSLLAGSITGLFLAIPKKIIAYLMALGTGILIGASSFELLIESIHKSGIVKTTNEGNGFLLDKKCISILGMTLVV